MKGMAAMITAPGLSVNFLKKEAYTGSHAGIRYYLCSAGDTLKACIYPEPWCFEATPEEDKTWREFPFSDEGLKSATAWISAAAETHRQSLT